MQACGRFEGNLGRAAHLEKARDMRRRRMIVGSQTTCANLGSYIERSHRREKAAWIYIQRNLDVGEDFIGDIFECLIDFVRLGRAGFDCVHQRATLDAREFAIAHVFIETLDALEIGNDLFVTRGRHQHREWPRFVALDVGGQWQVRVRITHEVRKALDRKNQAREHPRIGGAAIARVVGHGGSHVEVRGRKETRVVDDGIKKKTNCVHEGSNRAARTGARLCTKWSRTESADESQHHKAERGAAVTTVSNGRTFAFPL